MKHYEIIDTSDENVVDTFTLNENEILEDKLIEIFENYISDKIQIAELYKTSDFNYFVEIVDLVVYHTYYTFTINEL